MDIEVKVPNYNLYDTHNIQEELAKNINDIFSDEESFKPPFERKTGMSEALNESPAKTSESRTDGTADSNAGNANTVYADGEAENIEDEQIEGQLSIADWMETVREEKYGRHPPGNISRSGRVVPVDNADGDIFHLPVAEDCCHEERRGFKKGNRIQREGG